jgi:hypothetical protein
MNPHVTMGVNLNKINIPVVFEVASNAMFAGWADNVPLQGGGNGAEAARSADAINAAFRVGAGKFADFISVEAIYRIRGARGDENTRLLNNAGLTPDYTGNPSDGYEYQNQLGLYAGLDLFGKILKLGAGYTASFRVDEKGRMGATENGATYETVYPLFSGISLHANFSGVPNLNISLLNNLSFAWQRGEAPVNDQAGGKIIQPMGTRLPAWGTAGDPAGTGTQVDGLYSFANTFASGGLIGAFDNANKELQTVTTPNGVSTLNMQNTDATDGWFALWNTLSVKYNITQKASATVVLSNRLGVYDFVLVKDDVFGKWTTDAFEAAVFGTYVFSPNITFAAGLNLCVWGMTADITGVKEGQYVPKNLETESIGEIRLAIPIRFKVNF